MIQRIQSIWLVLAIAAAVATFKLPVFSGNRIQPDNIKGFSNLAAGSNFIILVVTVAVGLLAGIALFLYKDRKLQIRLTIGALILSIINIVLYFLQAKKFVPNEGHFSIYAIIALLIPVFLVLAARGINDDQKLVKSLDRLR